jgi:molybdenum cofactor biosynthesis protein B
MGAEEHRQQARQPVTCAVITVSDTRTETTDTSGRTIRERLEQAGHRVTFYAIIKDEPTEIRQLLQTLASGAEVQAVLLNGGTGISRRDTTYEAVVALLDKQLDGFGELFRMLSYHEVGAAAMLSRAVAGTYRHLVIFSTPGSTGAVRLAMDKLIVPELSHLVWEVMRQQPGRSVP